MEVDNEKKSDINCIVIFSLYTLLSLCYSCNNCVNVTMKYILQCSMEKVLLSICDFKEFIAKIFATRSVIKKNLKIKPSNNK